MQQHDPIELVFPPWSDLPDERRAIVRAAAESLIRQARARRMTHRPPRVIVAGTEAHFKVAMVTHYLADLEAEGTGGER